MKKITLSLFFLIISFGILATPSWIGNQSYSQSSTSQNVTFTVWQNDDYVGLKCEVGVSTDGGSSWTVYQMSYSGKNSNNSVWTLTQKINSSSNCLCYFHGYDEWGYSYYLNNSSNNYSFIVNPTTEADGNWNSGATWCDGTVPSSTSANYVIANNVTLNQDVTIGTLIINSGKTFTASDASSRTLTIAKSASGSSTTLTNNGTWANGTGGSTVVFTGAPSSGDAVHAIIGAIGFQNITIKKTSGLNNVGASFGTGSTVSGTLEIGYGGFVSTAPPTNFYNSSAILKFNQGSSAIYDVNTNDNSWSTTEVPQNITISSGTVNLNANRTATGNLFIDGGTLVLNNNSPNLTINGNWTRTSGAFTANTGTVTLGGTTNGIVTVTGGATMNTLVISKSSGAIAKFDCNLSTATLTVNSGAFLEVNPTKQLTVSSSFSNSGTLTLKSDATGTATIITPATMSGSGSYSVEQYLGATRNWYITSPVTNAKAPSGYTYYKYDETGGNTGYSTPETAYWTDFATETLLTPGMGFIALPATTGNITFTTQTGGKLNSGDVNVSLTRAGAVKTGFNLIGNPYPCHLGWTYNFVNSNSSLIESSIWIRTNGGTTNNSGQWSFATFNASASEAVPSVENAGIIPPMQAFWVRAKTGGTLTLNSELTKTHQALNPLKARANNMVERKKLRLQLMNGTAVDELLLYSDENALNTYDTYDSPKMSNNSLTVPELYTIAGSEQLVINGMQSIPLDTEIPLGFRTQENGQTFVIKSTEFTGFDSNIKVYIKDNQNLLNPETELTPETSYSFTSDATDNTTRLSVIFKSAGAVTASENMNDNNGLSIFADNNKHIIINTGSDISKAYSLIVYNSVGQKIIERQVMSNAYTLYKALESGVYFVKIDIDGKQTTNKVVIR
jgi:phosphotransferase system IIB component